MRCTKEDLIEQLKELSLYDKNMTDEQLDGLLDSVEGLSKSEILTTKYNEDGTVDVIEQIRIDKEKLLGVDSTEAGGSESAGGVNYPNSVDDVIITSGSAPGADYLSLVIGKSKGFMNHVHFFPEKQAQNRINKKIEEEGHVVKVPYAETQFGKKVVLLARRNLGVPVGEDGENTKHSRVHVLSARNWNQVKDATMVVAMAPMREKGDESHSNPNNMMVSGGTRDAVQMAILREIEVSVYDYETDKWFFWDYSLGDFVETDIVPSLTTYTAIVGSRDIQSKETFTVDGEERSKFIDEFNDNATNAMSQVYDKALSEIKERQALNSDGDSDGDSDTIIKYENVFSDKDIKSIKANLKRTKTFEVDKETGTHNKLFVVNKKTKSKVANDISEKASAVLGVPKDNISGVLIVKIEKGEDYTLYIENALVDHAPVVAMVSIVNNDGETFIGDSIVENMSSNTIYKIDNPTDINILKAKEDGYVALVYAHTEATKEEEAKEEEAKKEEAVVEKPTLEVSSYDPKDSTIVKFYLGGGDVSTDAKFLSNLYSVGVSIYTELGNNLIFTSSEAYYFSLKLDLSKDGSGVDTSTIDSLMAKLSKANGVEAKKISQSKEYQNAIAPYLNGKTKDEILESDYILMDKAITAKFDQNPKLKEKLLSYPDGTTFVENNSKFSKSSDTATNNLWGANLQKDGTLSGRNLTGKIISKYFKENKETETEVKPPIKPPKPVTDPKQMKAEIYSTIKNKMITNKTDWLMIDGGVNDKGKAFGYGYFNKKLGDKVIIVTRMSPSIGAKAPKNGFHGKYNLVENFGNPFIVKGKDKNAAHFEMVVGENEKDKEKYVSSAYYLWLKQGKIPQEYMAKDAFSNESDRTTALEALERRRQWVLSNINLIRDAESLVYWRNDNGKPTHVHSLVAISLSSDEDIETFKASTNNVVDTTSNVVDTKQEKTLNKDNYKDVLVSSTEELPSTILDKINAIKLSGNETKLNEAKKAYLSVKATGGTFGELEVLIDSIIKTTSEEIKQKKVNDSSKEIKIVPDDFKQEHDDDYYKLQGEFDASIDQKHLIQETVSFINSPVDGSKPIADRIGNQLFFVNGMGGTGKSTSIGRAIEHTDSLFIGATFTHAAKDVLISMTETMDPSQVLSIGTTASLLASLTPANIMGAIDDKTGLFSLHNLTAKKPINHDNRTYYPAKLSKEARTSYRNIVLVVDEASMTDIKEFSLFIALISAHPNLKIIMMGDYHQLPPVGSVSSNPESALAKKFFPYIPSNTLLAPPVAASLGIDIFKGENTKAINDAILNNVKTVELFTPNRQDPDSDLYKVIQNSAIDIEKEVITNSKESNNIQDREHQDVVLADGSVEFHSGSSIVPKLKELFTKETIGDTLYVAFNNSAVITMTKVIRDIVFKDNNNDDIPDIVLNADVFSFYSNSGKGDAPTKNGAKFKVTSIEDITISDILNSGQAIGQAPSDIEFVISKKSGIPDDYPFKSITIKMEDSKIETSLIIPERLMGFVMGADYTKEDVITRIMNEYSKLFEVRNARYRDSKSFSKFTPDSIAAFPAFTPFFYSYAVTTYKSQGSGYKNVIYDGEERARGDKLTALQRIYTALSRAKEKLFIVNAPVEVLSHIKKEEIKSQGSDNNGGDTIFSEEDTIFFEKDLEPEEDFGSALEIYNVMENYNNQQSEVFAQEKVPVMDENYQAKEESFKSFIGGMLTMMDSFGSSLKRGKIHLDLAETQLNETSGRIYHFDDGSSNIEVRWNKKSGSATPQESFAHEMVHKFTTFALKNNPEVRHQLELVRKKLIKKIKEESLVTAQVYAINTANKLFQDDPDYTQETRDEALSRIREQLVEQVMFEHNIFLQDKIIRGVQPTAEDVAIAKEKYDYIFSENADVEEFFAYATTNQAVYHAIADLEIDVDANLIQMLDATEGTEHMTKRGKSLTIMGRHLLNALYAIINSLAALVIKKQPKSGGEYLLDTFEILAMSQMKMKQEKDLSLNGTKKELEDYHKKQKEEVVDKHGSIVGEVYKWSTKIERKLDQVDLIGHKKLEKLEKKIDSMHDEYKKGNKNNRLMDAILSNFRADAGLEASSFWTNLYSNIFIRTDKASSGGTAHLYTLFRKGKEATEKYRTKYNKVVDDMFSDIFKDADSGTRQSVTMALYKTDMQVLIGQEDPLADFRDALTFLTDKDAADKESNKIFKEIEELLKESAEDMDISNYNMTTLAKQMFALSEFMITGEARLPDMQLNVQNILLRLPSTSKNLDAVIEHRVDSAAGIKLMHLMDKAITINSFSHLGKEDIDNAFNFFATHENQMLSATTILDTFSMYRNNIVSINKEFIIKKFSPLIKGYMEAENKGNKKFSVVSEDELKYYTESKFGQMDNIGFFGKINGVNYYKVVGRDHEPGFDEGMISTSTLSIGGISLRTILVDQIQDASNRGNKKKKRSDVLSEANGLLQMITSGVDGDGNAVSLSDYVSLDGDNHLIPKYDYDGGIIDYTILPSTSDKVRHMNGGYDIMDSLKYTLSKFEHIKKTYEVNIINLDAIMEHAEKEYLERPGDFVIIKKQEMGGKDKDGKETFAEDYNEDIHGRWNKLPEYVRAYVTNKTGSPSMLVPRFMVESITGEPRFSLSDMDYKFLNIKKHTRLRKTILAIEDYIFEIADYVKNIIVIRTGDVISQNIFSNMVTAVIKTHISPLEFLREYKAKWVELDEYKRLSEGKTKLEVQLSIANTDAKKKKLLSEIKSLNTRLENNAMHELIQDGQFSVIVEDIDPEEEAKGHIGEFLQKQVGRNKMTKAAGKVFDFVSVARGTTIYDKMMKMTQYGDILSRQIIKEKADKAFTLKNKRERNKEERIDLLNQLDQLFVNYSYLDHRYMKYAERVLGVYFTKFLFRSIKAMQQLFIIRPATALLFAGAEISTGINLKTSEDDMYDPLAAVWRRMDHIFDPNKRFFEQQYDQVIEAPFQILDVVPSFDSIIEIKK